MEHEPEAVNAAIIQGRCLELVGRNWQVGVKTPIVAKMPKEKENPRPAPTVVPAGSLSKAAGPKARPVPTTTATTEKKPLDRAAPSTSKPRDISATAPVHQNDEELNKGLAEIEELQQRLEAQKGAIMEEMALRWNANGDEEMMEWYREAQAAEREEQMETD